MGKVRESERERTSYNRLYQDAASKIICKVINLSASSCIVLINIFLFTPQVPYLGQSSSRRKYSSINARLIYIINLWFGWLRVSFVGLILAKWYASVVLWKTKTTLFGGETDLDRQMFRWWLSLVLLTMPSPSLHELNVLQCKARISRVFFYKNVFKGILWVWYGNVAEIARSFPPDELRHP